VVTGVDELGRSYVLSADELPAENAMWFWRYQPSDEIGQWIARIPEGAAAESIEPPAGGIYLAKVVIPPDEKPVATEIEGVGEDGFHVTRTIDFAYVLSGEITLLLDRESIVVHAGDVVVQQATNHAWRNDGPGSAEMLFVLHTPVVTSPPLA
jgi:quercetin dioxygenase-like cupin family protein